MCGKMIKMVGVVAVCGVCAAAVGVSEEEATSGDAGERRGIQPAAAWERIPKDLIWNFENMYQPCVLELPDKEYRYRMWFFGWAASDTNTGYAGCDAIFHARSKDLLNWEIYAGDGQWDATMNPKRWAPVIVPDEKPYDEWHNGDPSVVRKDGRFYMALSSTSKPFEEPVKGHPNRMLLCIMGATSDDGIHWLKTEQPLLIEPDEALEPEKDEGWTGDFHRPSLMWDQGRWRLWFDYWHPTKGVCMGYAENTGDFRAPGGFHVVSDLAKPLIPNWPNPEVVRIGNRYYSFADPTGYGPGLQGPDANWTGRALCEAVSDDGMQWRVIGYIAPDLDSAACHVPQALVTVRDGREWLYLFYATQRGGKNKDGVFDYRYDRIRCMRQPVPTPAD